jgi:Tfp pilus assembly protein PilV
MLGFTILEILVAMAVTSFGILGFTGLLRVMGDVEAEDTWRTKALFCAQAQMEELKFASATGNLFPCEGDEELADGSYRGMHRQWTVKHSARLDDLLEVTVECAYPWKGKTERVGLSTLVFPED